MSSVLIPIFTGKRRALRNPDSGHMNQTAPVKSAILTVAPYVTFLNNFTHTIKNEEEVDGSTFLNKMLWY